MIEQGTIVAGYRVDGILGEGGMGTVYRATQLSLNRVVALKLLAGELSDDPGFRTRFEREGQLQAGLDHQNIVTVYEAGQTDQGLFLAMRLIDGPTLKELILRGKLDVRRALRILAQVAQALDEAHAAGLIHRDIKPQNILIGKGDHTYLADFGLIKAPDDAGLTGTGQFLGTIDYVAPEQIQGDPATGASDIYALSAVLFECLTGRVPFGRANEAATLHAHVVSPPPKPSELRPDLPPALDDVITAGMAKAPEDRPALASELIRSAAGALAGGVIRSALGAAGGQGAQHTHVASTPAPETLASPPPAPETLASPPPAAGTLASAPPAAAGAGVLTRASAPVAPAAPAAPTAPATPAETSAPAPPPPATEGRETRGSPQAPGPRARRVPIVAVLALAVVAIAAGFVVGHGGQARSGPSFSSSDAAGHLQLRYPSRWLLSSAAVANVPGMSFVTPIVITAPSPAAGTLTAGEVPGATGPTLLSAAFRGHVSGALPSLRPVSLGGTDAASYPALNVSGLSGPATAYAIPTTAGTATIVCAGASAGFQATCGQVAATVRLVGAGAFPLGPVPAYARRLSSVLTRLDAAVRAPQSALAAAHTPAAQAGAAAQLSQAYATAAGQLGRLTVSPRDRVAHDQSTAALRELAAGYGSAATAARQNRVAAYAAAGRQITAGTAALRSALHGFAALGYHVSS